jgi:hypothetical protein
LEACKVRVVQEQHDIIAKGLAIFSCLTLEARTHHRKAVEHRVKILTHHLFEQYSSPDSHAGVCTQHNTIEERTTEQEWAPQALASSKIKVPCEKKLRPLEEPEQIN